MPIEHGDRIEPFVKNPGLLTHADEFDELGMLVMFSGHLFLTPFLHQEPSGHATQYLSRDVVYVVSLLAVYDPGWQKSQERPFMEIMFSGHGVQVALTPSEMVPVGHLEHCPPSKYVSPTLHEP